MAVFFELRLNLIECLGLAWREIEFGTQTLVALHEFACRKTLGDAMLGGMVLDEVHYGMYAAMHGGIGVGTAEVGAFGSLLIARHVHGVLHKFLYTRMFGSRDGHHRYAQQLLHQVHSYGAVIALEFVHHIQSKHYGHIEFYELHCEI